jgi:hypothetical protein
MAASGFEFADFEKIIYEHAPRGMGQFSRVRMPEPTARELYNFLKTLGWRAMMYASTSAGVASEAGTTYTFTVENRGKPGKGISAGDFTMSIVVPKGASVVTATGEGYTGITRDVEYISNPQRLSPFNNPNPPIERARGDMAVWQFKKVAAGEKQTFTLTLTGENAAAANFTGSMITFGKPVIRRVPGLTFLDHRLADKGDIIRAPSLEWALPPTPPATAR